MLKTAADKVMRNYFIHNKNTPISIYGKWFLNLSYAL